MKFHFRPVTFLLAFVGVVAGVVLVYLAVNYPPNSALKLILINLGGALVATSLVSLVLDMVWSNERAKYFGDKLDPILKDFDRFTRQLEKLEGRLGAFKQLGLNSCFKSRAEALEQFLAYSREFVDGTSAKDATGTSIGGTVDLVCSSARGLMGFLDREAHGEHHQIQTQWRNLITEKPEHFRALLTHPAYAHLRQPAEERAPGDIELEVLKTAIYLHCVAGMTQSNLRFYRGSPTVFTIQAGQHILLNPYPYGKMAMETLCLEFESSQETTFVKSFVGMHFDHTWAFLDRPEKVVDGKPMVVGVRTFSDILVAFGECTYLGEPDRLRLQYAQVVALDTFTQNLKRGRVRQEKMPRNESPFVKYLEDNKLCCTDQHQYPQGTREVET